VQRKAENRSNTGNLLQLISAHVLQTEYMHRPSCFSARLNELHVLLPFSYVAAPKEFICEQELVNRSQLVRLTDVPVAKEGFVWISVEHSEETGEGDGGGREGGLVFLVVAS